MGDLIINQHPYCETLCKFRPWWPRSESDPVKRGSMKTKSAADFNTRITHIHREIKLLTRHSWYSRRFLESSLGFLFLKNRGILMPVCPSASLSVYISVCLYEAEFVPPPLGYWTPSRGQMAWGLKWPVWRNQSHQYCRTEKYIVKVHITRFQLTLVYELLSIHKLGLRTI